MQFNFGKTERLKSEKEIKNLFDKGASNFINPVRAIFLFYSSDTIESKILVSVSKRHFKEAVDRNLLKRRMREAYRLNSYKLKENLNSNQVSVKIAFIYSSGKILTFKEIEAVVLKNIEYIISKMPPSEENN